MSYMQPSKYLVKNLEIAEKHFKALHGNSVNESLNITAILVQSTVKETEEDFPIKIIQKFAKTRTRICLKYLNNKLLEAKDQKRLESRNRRQLSHFAN